MENIVEIFKLHPSFYKIIENYNYETRVVETLEAISERVTSGPNKYLWKVDSLNYLKEDKSELLISIENEIYIFKNFDFGDDRVREVIKDKFNFTEDRMSKINLLD